MSSKRSGTWPGTAWNTAGRAVPVVFQMILFVPGARLKWNAGSGGLIMPPERLAALDTPETVY